MNRIYLLILIVGLGMGCQRSEEVSFTISTEGLDIYVAGELKEPDQAEFTDFRIDFISENDVLGQTFWGSSISTGELGSTIILGNYASEAIPSRPIFGLQFWSDTLEDKEYWTSEELEDFFAPGKSFNFGQGVNHVELKILFPIGSENFDAKASRPSYLMSPQGSLTITSLEDFNYPILRNNLDRSYGKLVKCTFSGQLGRYNLEADQADGDPSFFVTDEIIELRNCEALFYVEYARI